MLLPWQDDFKFSSMYYLQCSILLLMKHSYVVPRKCWSLLLILWQQATIGSWNLWLLKTCFMLYFEGEKLLSAIPRPFTRQIYPADYFFFLYWEVKLKTIIEGYHFVLLTYVFSFLSIYDFFSPRFYQRISPVFADLTEGSSRAENRNTLQFTLALCFQTPGL